MISNILTWLGVVDQRPAQLDTVSAFLGGASIQQIAAEWPGEMLVNQQRVQAELRDFIISLENEISELQAQLCQE